jgi:uncharacterized protein (TIGR03382 family)
MHARNALPLLLLFGCVATDDVTTGEQAIVGGQTATTTDFPTVVAVQQNGTTICSGVLVHASYVLSAASCFDNTSGIRVRIGDANLGDGATQGMTIDAAQIIKHPQFSYNDSLWRHDVALVKLAQAVTTVTPTAIGRDTTALGSQITQAGFGSNNNSGGGMGVLRSLATTNIDCAQAGDSSMTNANLLCFNAADGNGSCNGDGGAPSFAAARVVGVGSGGTGNSCTSGLDVYSALAAELGFLDQYVPPPQGTPPTPPPPPPPPPTNNPDTPGGTGTGPGRNPGTTGNADRDGNAQMVTCSAGGDAGGLSVLALAIGAVLRRRRR